MLDCPRAELLEGVNEHVASEDADKKLGNEERQAAEQPFLGEQRGHDAEMVEQQREPRERGDELLKWIVTAERIKHLNQYLNNTVPKVETLFKDNGFRGCILKGQGIAQLYPHPELRTPGDIDIWVCGRRKEIISFVKNKCNSSSGR